MSEETVDQTNSTSTDRGTDRSADRGTRDSDSRSGERELSGGRQDRSRELLREELTR